MLSRERPEGRNAAIVGLLDIGTSKIACLIAALEPAEGQRRRYAGESRQ